MNILEILVRVMAPILTFTTDEVWESYPEGLRNVNGHVANVQLAGWPHEDDFTPRVPLGAEQKLVSDFEVILEVREHVTKALETARGEKVINKSQEAVVELVVPQSIREVLSQYHKEVLEEIFIVAEIRFVSGEELAADISRSDLEKCPRCWNFRVLGQNTQHPDLCERCAQVLQDTKKTGE